MVGFRPSPLSGLASSRVGSRRREAALWEMSLSIYRSTIRPISSGRIKSYTRWINPPPLFLPEFSTCMSFRLSKRFLYLSFLHHCLLLPFVILSACVCLLFHCAFFFFSWRSFYWLISSIGFSLSSLISHSLHLCYCHYSMLSKGLARQVYKLWVFIL